MRITERTMTLKVFCETLLLRTFPKKPPRMIRGDIPAANRAIFAVRISILRYAMTLIEFVIAKNSTKVPTNALLSFEL